MLVRILFGPMLLDLLLQIIHTLLILDWSSPANPKFTVPWNRRKMEAVDVGTKETGQFSSKAWELHCFFCLKLVASGLSRTFCIISVAAWQFNIETRRWTLSQIRTTILACLDCVLSERNSIRTMALNKQVAVTSAAWAPVSRLNSLTLSFSKSFSDTILFQHSASVVA